jgi:hypothetical protein
LSCVQAFVSISSVSGTLLTTTEIPQNTIKKNFLWIQFFPKSIKIRVITDVKILNKNSGISVLEKPNRRRNKYIPWSNKMT